jgi:hypothetical protein
MGVDPGRLRRVRLMVLPWLFWSAELMMITDSIQQPECRMLVARLRPATMEIFSFLREPSARWLRICM